jgi:acyl carrier protein
MNETLTYVIATINGISRQKCSVSPQTSLFSDLDLDSLQFLELLEILGKHFHVNLLSQLSDMRPIETPELLATLIDKLLTENGSRSETSHSSEPKNS